MEDNRNVDLCIAMVMYHHVQILFNRSRVKDLSSLMDVD